MCDIARNKMVYTCDKVRPQRPRPRPEPSPAPPRAESLYPTTLTPPPTLTPPHRPPSPLPCGALTRRASAPQLKDYADFTEGSDLSAGWEHKCSPGHLPAHNGGTPAPPAY